ncbi:MAG: hypothetical protein J0H67_19110 [Rhodospirillales bacterium]|nr:hypothetical protein [Rhodospirillales bacterium]MBN8901204.1 hypothetical protein [Rhodospirillales bacterium]MBN8906442.1 hypothetical protein [Rhodospirillales bacterium]
MSGGVEHGQAIQDIARTAALARRTDILAAYVAQRGAMVQEGPFAGISLPLRAAERDGDLLAKLVGCYEMELHEAFAALIDAQPEVVMAIGAAEGYYAAGLARALPGVHVHGFEPSDLAQDICREAARLNGVEQRVSVGGQCTPVLLQHLLGRAQRRAVLCDAEGDERLLIDPVRIPALSTSFLIVECHDHVDAGITQMLAERLSPTHELSAVREGPRDPNAIPFLAGLDGLDRALALCEFRPRTMHWLIGVPRRG